MNFIMFGAPGAGKGTHADRLAKRYDLDHISTGDLFRAEAATGSELGKKLQEIMDAGQLVDDETVFAVLESALKSRNKGVIFDGFPRTVHQAEMLHGLLDRHNRKLDAVICINVPEEELVRRIHLRALISNRSDDNEVTIRKRLQEYESKTLPVLNYYRNSGLIVDINGQSEIEETAEKIKSVVDSNIVYNSWLQLTKQVHGDVVGLTEEWDKTFAKSDKVDHQKVTFKNRYGITLAADLYMPKNVQGKLPAVAVCGPFGAVKEQCSGLYAQTLAEQGFLTVAFDPSFTGESGGEPRNVASPGMNTEDFCASVDFLVTNDKVDPERVGICGICGWGGMALNAAAIDTRIKATVTATMYDMSRVNAQGYFDAMDEDARYKLRQQLNAQRTEDSRKGSYQRAGGVVDTLPEDAPQFVKDYYDYYKTPRGYHKRSVNSNQGWNTTSALAFMNTHMLAYTKEIRSAVLMLHGDKAHSCYFSKDAFADMVSGSRWAANKELMLIPNGVHTSLYDNKDGLIPWQKIVNFYKENM